MTLPMQPSARTREQIDACALFERDYSGLTSNFRIRDLIEANGGSFEYIHAGDENQTDGLIVYPDDTFKVRLSAYSGPQRDTFIMAHELGHFVLHWQQFKEDNPGKEMRAPRSADPMDKLACACNTQANWFAASFLMPEHQFRETFERVGLERTAKAFCLTEDAIKVRAEDLGINIEENVPTGP